MGWATHSKFRRGILYEWISYDGRIHSSRILRVWPAPCAWRRPSGRALWVPHTPDLRIQGWAPPVDEDRTGEGEGRDPQQRLFPTRFDRGAHHGAPSFHSLAWAAIPPDVRDQVCRFGNHQWEVLRLLAGGPPALELMESNPVLGLALALAESLVSESLERQEIDGLLCAKRTTIVDFLGFRRRPATVRILGKFDPATCDLEVLKELRPLIEDGATFKTLCHLPSLTRTTIGILANQQYRRMVSFALLEKVSVEPASESNWSVLEMLETVIAERPLSSGRIGTIRSLSELRRLHRTALEEKLELRAYAEFPPPPIHASEDIVPLTSPAQLVFEGTVQNHCLGTMPGQFGAVVQGRSYFYRVLRPQRATLHLRRDDGEWKIQELRCSRNRAVEPQTASAVRSWLATAPETRSPGG